MKTASAEIRSIVVKAYLSGKASKRQLADIFGFHLSAINRWLRLYRTENRLAPLEKGHMAAAFSPEECDRLIELLRDRPDITLAEIRDSFAKNCSLMAVHRTLERLGFRRDKKAGGKGRRKDN